MVLYIWLEAILGFENIVGVERYMKISRIIPLEIEILNAAFYAKGSIIESFKRLKDKNYKTHRCRPIKVTKQIEYDNNYKEILITGGIGDFITLESLFSTRIKR